MGTTGAAGGAGAAGFGRRSSAMGGETSDGGNFSLPYAGFGAGGNSAAEELHHDRGIVRATRADNPASSPALYGRNAAARGRTRTINPDGAINSLLTRFTQRQRTGPRVLRARTCKRRRS